MAKSDTYHLQDWLYAGGKGMKFSEKLVASCLLAIAFVLSLGASWMILQNHANLLSTTLQEKEDNLTLQGFTLESKLNQDAQSYEIRMDKTNKKLDSYALYYVRQYAAMQSKKGNSYILLDKAKHVVFDDSDLSYEKITKQNEMQHIYKEGNQRYAVFSYAIVCANHQYTLLSCSNITGVFQERTRQYHNFIIIDVCMLLIAFLLLYGISHHLTKPIKKMSMASKRIASGHYDERTNIHTKDEVGELSESFDEMAEATQHTIQKLKNSADAKEEFMGSFSHEIKTPMTAIIGFSDMLRTYDCDETTRREAANYIYHQGKRLENLSQTMMQLLSISAKQPDINAVSMLTLLQQLQSYYHGTTYEKQLQFELEACFVKANEELLFICISNLIDNACKASPNHESVVISGQSHAHIYEICICDHGIGMTEEELSKIEQPFYMADASRSHEIGGAGLGLSLCKRIAMLHNTTLTYVSKPQEGTKVSFQLEVTS